MNTQHRSTRSPESLENMRPFRILPHIRTFRILPSLVVANEVKMNWWNHPKMSAHLRDFTEVSHLMQYSTVSKRIVRLEDHSIVCFEGKLNSSPAQLVIKLLEGPRSNHQQLKIHFFSFLPLIPSRSYVVCASSYRYNGRSLTGVFTRQQVALLSFQP